MPDASALDASIPQYHFSVVWSNALVFEAEHATLSTVDSVSNIVLINSPDNWVDVGIWVTGEFVGLDVSEDKLDGASVGTGVIGAGVIGAGVMGEGWEGINVRRQEIVRIRISKKILDDKQSM